MGMLAKWWDEFVGSLEGKDKDQLKWLLEQANKWRVPDSASYIYEINRRVNYLDGEMYEDAEGLLKSEFPKTWQEIKDQMFLFPIAQYIWDKKSKVFDGDGNRFYLVDKIGEELDVTHPASIAFSFMLERSQINLSLKKINRAVEACNECAAKIWWNEDRLIVDRFPTDKAHIAINPLRPWDPDSAFAVLFERSGYEGPSGKPIYEVWGTRDISVAQDTDVYGRQIFHPTVHYETSEKEQIQVNEMDENPFVFRGTNRPMLPMVWFKNYSGDIYSAKGGDNIVKMTRAINLNLTWLNWCMHWQMTPVPIFRSTNDVLLSKLKQTYLHSPKAAMSIPPGVSLEFIHPNMDPGPFTSTYEMFIQYMALMNNLSPKSIDIQGGIPQSGIAMRIEMSNLVEYRNEQIPIYMPFVEDLLNRCIVVWNTYAPAVHGKEYQIPDDVYPAWTPGIIDSGPIDYAAMASLYSKEIDHGISSEVDWLMTRHNIDNREEAEAKLRNNLDIHQEVLKKSTMYPEEIRPELFEFVRDDATGDEE